MTSSISIQEPEQIEMGKNKSEQVCERCLAGITLLEEEHDKFKRIVYALLVLGFFAFAGVGFMIGNHENLFAHAGTRDALNLVDHRMEALEDHCDVVDSKVNFLEEIIQREEGGVLDEVLGLVKDSRNMVQQQMDANK